MNRLQLSVGIVTYNNENIIGETIESVAKSIGLDSIKLFVYDNVSSDQTIDKVLKTHPKTEVIYGTKNIGFGRGHNKIIDRIESTYHLILNPDITFDSELLGGLIQYMEENPDVLILQPEILSPDLTIQKLPKRNPKLKYIVGRFLQDRFLWARKLNNEYTMEGRDYSAICDIDVCSGAFMFVRTDILKKVGGFDRRYFMYFEDADLSREVRAYGRIVLNPDFRIVHEWGRDNKKSMKGIFRYLSSMMKYLFKWNICKKLKKA